MKNIRMFRKINFEAIKLLQKPNLDKKLFQKANLNKEKRENKKSEIKKLSKTISSKTNLIVNLYVVKNV